MSQKDCVENENEEKMVEDSIDCIEKPYTQFSKKIVVFCAFNLLAIEIFSMFIIWKTKDTSLVTTMITAIAVTCLGAVIWYMKNSEAEKKARISAEIERMKIKGVPTKNPFDYQVEDSSSFNGDISNTSSCKSAKG